jgi:multisubunit Na+/H+ antiporter MnhB subunit
MIARTSPIVKLAIQAASPIAVLIAAFALFAGHNRPGGGFAAGLLLGAIVVLRTVAGLQQPRHAFTLLAIGGVIVGATAIAPLLWGDVLLDQALFEWTDVALLGTVKTGTSLVFDVGVTAVVVGLVVAVLDGLGATSLAEDSVGSDTGPSDEIGSAS